MVPGWSKPAAGGWPLRQPFQEGRLNHHLPGASQTTAVSSTVSCSGDESLFTAGRAGGACKGRAPRALPATDHDLLSMPRGSGDGSTAASEDEAVYMALEMKTNGTVGCAYLVTTTSTLYLYGDTRIAGLELVESLLFQARPTNIIVPSRSPDKFIDFLDRLSHEAKGGGDEAERRPSFTLHPVVSTDFDPDYGRQALVDPSENGIYENHSTLFTTAAEDTRHHENCDSPVSSPAMKTARRNKLMVLGTFVNLEDHVSLGCAGALIRDIKERAAASASRDTGLLKLRAVKTVSYDKCMFVAADTLLSLQIFRPGSRQNEPGVGTTGGPTRGRSIFDLFHSQALTSQGRCKLREIFIRPSLDIEVIKERHQTISSFLDPQNRDAVCALRATLKKVKNIHPILVHLQKGIFVPGGFSSVKHGAWSNLKDFCWAILQLVDTMHETWNQDFGVVQKALRQIDVSAILRVKESLSETIDFQGSMASRRNIVAGGVKAELDALKISYGRLQERLDAIYREHRSRFLAEAQDEVVGCVFHPQKGYLLVASSTVQTRCTSNKRYDREGGQIDYITWEDSLSEDGLLYFKTDGLRAVDTEFGDLAGQIIDLEVHIIHGLGLDILYEENALLDASRAVGEIDSILALASGARAMNLTRPRMTVENILRIREGRNLLHVAGTKKFVPNDCLLAGGTGRRSGGGADVNTTNTIPTAVVLTGPNHSGKSVYLKQVAVILFLAHIGSYVPAAEAIVGITDRILARIATRESVSRDESAFGFDLRQAAFSIKFATRRSLVLVDEFGKGTATADGAALLDAFLQHFLCLGPGNAPKVLAATHFHEIFELEGRQWHPRLAMWHMGVTVNPRAVKHDEGVEYLHILREGRSTDSFGCHCAAISGVTPTVVERASQIASLLRCGEDLCRICLQPRETGEGKLGNNEAQARLFLSGMANALDSGLAWQDPRKLLEQIFGRTVFVEY